MISCRIVDLSHKLYPGKEEYSLELQAHNTNDLYRQYPVDEDTWYILQDIHMSSHCGTHIEFPYHHNRRGMDAGAFPLARLIGDGVRLDFRAKGPGEATTLKELQACDDKIHQGDMVLFDLNCARHYRTARSHDRPYIAHEAIKRKPPLAETILYWIPAPRSWSRTSFAGMTTGCCTWLKCCKS